MKTLDIRHPIRSDIQGLRGLAVIYVILAHLFPSTLPGGFIGVDIFFVISGYVITNQLKSLWSQDKEHAISEFYARRVRRILPAALLVLTTTVLVTKFLLGPIFGADSARDGFWSTLFLANFHFASQSQDYFATGVPQSLVQHYWSLAIEEQFYLLWPIILLSLFKWVKSKAIVNAITGLLLLASLSFCLINLYVAQNLNFFNSGARGWQLLAGCLLALLAVNPRDILILRIGALGILFTFAFLLTPTMNWPNIASLAVVTASVILCLPMSGGRFRALDNRIFVYLGDISFLLYLWHWPILMISKNYHSEFNLQQTLLVLLCTVIFSVTTHHFFEKPIRRSQILIRHPRITIVGGLTLVLITAIFMRSVQ